MFKDEIVEEVRRERNKIAQRHGNDLGRLFEALKVEEQQGGRVVVALAPRRPSPPARASGE